MTHLFTEWLIWCALIAILVSLARIIKGQRTIMATLKDVQDGQTKERALVEKLVGIIKTNVPPGTLTPEDQAIVDSVAADQATTLAEDPTATPGT